MRWMYGVVRNNAKEPGEMSVLHGKSRWPGVRAGGADWGSGARAGSRAFWLSA